MDNPKDGVRPFIRIYTKYRSICVNLAAHDILGKPPYLEFYWNSEKKIFFISPLREAKPVCAIKYTVILQQNTICSVSICRIQLSWGVEKMKAQVSNISKNYPAIRLKLGKRMSMNKKLFHELGNPANIHFWWGQSQRVLLIGSASGKTPFSFEINERYYAKRSSFKIDNSKLMQAVMKITDWRSDMIYVIYGEYISELGMVAFKLDDATASPQRQSEYISP